MPKIIFQSGNHQGMSIEVDREMVLGRDMKCEIHLVSPDVSRRHCIVQPQGGSTVVVDLGSRNGTFVNGNQVFQPTVLNHNDVVSLGDIVLRFESTPLKITPTFESSVHMDGVFDENQLEMSIAMEGLNYLDLNSTGDLKKKLETFYKVAHAVSEQPSADQLSGVILNCMAEIFPQMERGFILTGNTSDNLKEEGVYFRNHRESETTQLKISKTVVHMVMDRKEALLCKDAFNDAGFSGSMSLIEEDVRGFMCVPLIAMDKLYGLIQIETSNAMTPFTKDDLDLLIGISSLAALFVRTSSLVRTATLEANKRAQLARFFSPKVAENVMNQKLELGGEIKTGTVLFCDIVGFTSMSEKVSAAEMVARLNQYFEIMVKIILEEQGTVDKFGGDAILSVWGAPEPIENDGVCASTAALLMQNAIVPFNLELEKQGATPLKMGIGIHSGKFIAGNIGSKDRMEYTIIGDDVNTAKRVESTATGHMLMISEAVIDQAASCYVGTRFNPIPLKGKSKPLSLLAVRGLKKDNHYLVSYPFETNGLFGKVASVNSEKNRIRVVVAGELEIGKKISLKLLLAEDPDAGSFEATVIQKCDKPLYFDLSIESDNYILKHIAEGVRVKEVDVFWMRK